MRGRAPKVSIPLPRSRLTGEGKVPTSSGGPDLRSPTSGDIPSFCYKRSCLRPGNPVLELLAQLRLHEFAGRSARQNLDEGGIIRHLPLGKMRQQAVRANREMAHVPIQSTINATR